MKTTKTTRKPIDYKQLQALRNAREILGRTWKSQIGTSWMNGVYSPALPENDDTYLQQFRNQHGPTRLHALTNAELDAVAELATPIVDAHAPTVAPVAPRVPASIVVVPVTESESGSYAETSCFTCFAVCTDATPVYEIKFNQARFGHRRVSLCALCIKTLRSATYGASAC